MKKIITLLIVAVSLNITAQESILLRLNYKKGFKQLTTMEMSQDMGVMKSKMVMDMKSVVTEVKDGVSTTENTFKKITMSTDGQGQKMNYDSSLKEENMDDNAKMMHGRMKPMLESVILMYFSDLGEITDVKIKSGNANAEQFKNAMSMTFPKEKVQKGSTWSKKETLQGGIEVNYKYTINSITDKFVLIDVVGSMSGTATGDVKGQTTIYKKSGVMHKSDVVTTINMMGQKVTSILKVTTKNL